MMRLSQLLLHPVRALRPPAIGAIGRDVIAVFDHHQRDRSFCLARQPFRIPGGDDAVEPPIHDEKRTDDVLCQTFKR